MNLTLVSATAKDLGTFVAFMRQLQEDDPWSCPFDEAAATSALRGLIENPTLGRAWLIHADQQPIGYIVLTMDYSLEYGGKCAWVDEFFIQKQHRGKGLGAEAMRLFEKEARKLGALTVHLQVNEGNRAIELYRRMGFEGHGRQMLTKWLVPHRGAR